MRRLIFVLPFLLGGALLAQENSAKPRLALGEPAPEIQVTTLDNKPTSLAGLRNANPNKVIVLQFGSLTDPIFRNHATSVDRLAARDVDKAIFVIVYQKEFHAADSESPLALNESGGFNLAAPTSQTERMALAKSLPERLGIKNETIVVDAWSNVTSQRYGSFPNMTFVIDSKGVLQAGYPFMDPAKVQAAVDALASGKSLPDELKGSVKSAGPAPFDSAIAAMEMTGGRGPAAIAAVLDRADIPDDKRITVITAVAGYLADVQNFRQARGGAPARAGVGTMPATMAARGPQDVQKAITDLRASAEKVKPIIRQNLNAKDAAALFQALDNLTPAQRLFSNP